MKFIFKSQNNLCNNFRIKNLAPQILTSVVVQKFQCELCNESYYRECIRHLAVESGERIGISPTHKRVQCRKDSVVYHHLSNCNYSSTFKDFSVLCPENKQYLSELKENLFIMKDRPSTHRNVRSAPLCLFGWVLFTLLTALCGLLWSFFTYFT